MHGSLFPEATAIWLGILTSISPCPMATNLVAISFISRAAGSTARVLVTGLSYTLGRAFTYAALGSLIVSSVLSIPKVSLMLQYWMNRLLGPILILAGMFLLEMIRINFSTSIAGNGLQEHARSWGIPGAGLLGMIFALSFCPVSAALFFGSLIPLSLKADSPLSLPILYGIGTGLPVSVFAAAMALGARSLSKALNRLSSIEKWSRYATGTVFIMVGIYYICDHILEVF